MDYRQFVNDPRNGDVLWWLADDTHEVVVIALCPTCGVKARHTKGEMLHFEFRHEPWGASARTIVV